MRQTLYLHIGTHRTATSSIQAFLKSNQEQLARRGYLVPYGTGRHALQMSRIFSGRTRVRTVAKELAQEAAQTTADIHSILISDEDICARRNLSPLAKFTKYFDVVVLFSMRRQDLWLESWHQQNVKWQWDPKLAHLTFPEFMKRRSDFHWIHYDRTVDQLSAALGPQNLRLRVFERAQMPGGPIACFAEDIGLGHTDGLKPPPHKNSSLLPVVSEFMRTLPLDEFADAKRARVEAACFALDRHLRDCGYPQSQLLLDRPAREEVMSHYAPGNRRVAEQHFGRSELFLEPLPSADSPLAPQQLPSDSYDTMRDFVVPLLRNLVSRYL